MEDKNTQHSLNEIERLEKELQDAKKRGEELQAELKEAKAKILEVALNEVKVRISEEWRLFAACSEGNLEEVQYLIEVCKVNPESKDKGGYTPLMIACQDGHAEVAEYLIEERSVNVGVKAEDGETALWLAKKTGDESLILIVSNNGGIKRKIKKSEGVEK